MRALAWVAMLGMFGAGAAFGQPSRSGNAEAKKLFDDGRALVKAGKLDDACPLFAKSYELERALGTELNLADCQERLGHLADAWRLFDDAAVQAEHAGDTKRQGVSRDRANALLSKIGTIVVEVADPSAPGLVLTIGGTAVVAAAQLERKVDPGSVGVSAHVPDRPGFETTTRVEASKTVVVKVPSFAPTVAVAPPPPPPQSNEPRSRRARGRVILGAALAGVGVAAIATSVIVGVSAHNLDREQFSNGNCTSTPAYSTVCNAPGAHEVDRAGKDANIGTGIGIAGLVLAAGGAVIYLTAPREVVIVPTATATSAGVAFVGSF